MALVKAKFGRCSFRHQNNQNKETKLQHVTAVDEVKETENDKFVEYRDILSFTIICQLWHVADNIFKYLDAVSLLNCEKVCDLWKNYLIKERVWQKCVETYARRYPSYIEQVGWWKMLPKFGGESNKDILVYRHTYWKMTNLNKNWALNGRSPSEQKKIFHRSGPVTWKMIPMSSDAGRAVSVYNSGKGFIIKVHDQMGLKFRCSHYNGAGTITGDSLSMDANDSKIVVAGYNSQKVWVFTIDEEESPPLTMVPEFLARMSVGKPRSKQMVVKLTKFIAATGGVMKVQLHSDSVRLAVLIPHNSSVEIWDITSVQRLHRFTLTPDASIMVWRKDTLVVAPFFSGVVQVFNTKNKEDKNEYEEMASLVGNFRKIDAMAVYENLVATAETRIVKLWQLSSASTVSSWTATKTHVSALYMNDTIVVTGSGAGIVKLWDLSLLLTSHDTGAVAPLRRINMKGVLHYPIKDIFQCMYTDLVIIAKYEGKKKKDKVKIVEVKWN